MLEKNLIGNDYNDLGNNWMLLYNHITKDYNTISTGENMLN